VCLAEMRDGRGEGPPAAQVRPPNPRRVHRPVVRGQLHVPDLQHSGRRQGTGIRHGGAAAAGRIMVAVALHRRCCAKCEQGRSQVILMLTEIFSVNSFCRKNVGFSWA
jgi:hypothetical protein